MTDSAEKLLALLLERKLLPETQVASLRKQVSDSVEPIQAMHILKMLHRKGKLTEFQARDLLAEVSGSRSNSSSGNTSANSADAKNTSPKKSSLVDDELGLADDGQSSALSTDKGRESRSDSTTSGPQKKTVSVAAQVAPVAVELSSSVEDSTLSGGMEDLLDDPLLLNAETAADPLQPLPSGKKGWGGFWPRGKSGKKKSSSWDSPLFLVGGGGLLLLLIAGSVLAFMLTRGSGDELFDAAEKDYMAGAYSQAISKYDRFLTRNSGHPKAGLARVRRGLAEVRQYSGQKNWEQSLERAQKVLPQIENETEFTQARPELAGILPDIAEGFADLASGTSDSDQAVKLLERQSQAMELVGNPVYLPGSQRAGQESRIQKINDKVEVVHRSLDRQKRLGEAIAQINAAAANGNASQTFEIRAALLKLYPRLESNEELKKAVLSASHSLREQVKPIAMDLVIQTDDDSTSAKSITLANAKVASTPSSEDELKGRVVTVLIDGAIYGLSASDDVVRWRRYVGSLTNFWPQRIGSDIDADVLAVDQRRQEVLRLSCTTGQVVWRAQINEDFAPPLLRADEVLVALNSGKLIVLNALSGRLLRAVRFPQRLSASPAISADGTHVAQVGDDSTVFILNSQNLACTSVIYLGQKSGTIKVAPAFVSEFLLISHNHALERSQLHIYARSQEGEWQTAQAPLGFSGHISRSPVVNRSEAIVVTDRGGIDLIQIDPADKVRPLKSLSTKPGTESTLVLPSIAITDGTLFVGDRRLSAFSLEAVQSTLPRRWVNDEGDIFIGELTVVGKTLFHVRRRLGRPGVVVSALDVDRTTPNQSRKPFWQTVVAAGAAGGVIEDAANKRLLVATAAGELFAIDGAAITAKVANRPLVAAQSGGFFSQLARVDNSQFVLTARPPNGEYLWLVGGVEGSAKELRFDVKGGAIASTPVFLEAGIVVGSTVGQISLFDPSTGKQKSPPFQARIEAGQAVDWIKPAIFERTSFAIADNRNRIYAINAGVSPKPLLLLGETSVSSPIVSNMVAIADKLVTVVRSNVVDEVVIRTLPKLDSPLTFPLSGRCVAGPFAAGSTIVIAVEPGGLFALDAEAKAIWNAELMDASIVGEPVIAADKIYFTLSDGRLWEVDMAAGQGREGGAFGEPVVGGLVKVRSQWIARAVDGTVLMLAAP